MKKSFTDVSDGKAFKALCKSLKTADKAASSVLQEALTWAIAHSQATGKATFAIQVVSSANSRMRADIVAYILAFTSWITADKASVFRTKRGTKEIDPATRTEIVTSTVANLPAFATWRKENKAGIKEPVPYDFVAALSALIKRAENSKTGIVPEQSASMAALEAALPLILAGDLQAIATAKLATKPAVNAVPAVEETQQAIALAA